MTRPAACTDVGAPGDAGDAVDAVESLSPLECTAVSTVVAVAPDAAADSVVGVDGSSVSSVSIVAVGMPFHVTLALRVRTHTHTQHDATDRSLSHQKRNSAAQPVTEPAEIDAIKQLLQGHCLLFSPLTQKTHLRTAPHRPAKRTLIVVVIRHESFVKLSDARARVRQARSSNATDERTGCTTVTLAAIEIVSSVVAFASASSTTKSSTTMSLHARGAMAAHRRCRNRASTSMATNDEPLKSTESPSASALIARARIAAAASSAFFFSLPIPTARRRTLVCAVNQSRS